MTLQEKFENAPIIYDNDLNSTIDYESIADEFAIGFVEWCAKEENNIYFETKQLLKIYKKTL